MALLLWDESLRINIEEIDNQHENLFNIINDLHDSLKNDSNEIVVRPQLNSLLQLLIVHFSTEEKWMKKNNYPDLMIHKQKHQEYLSKIKEYVSDYKAQLTTLPTKDILLSIAGWHNKHIIEYDKKIGRFIKEINR
ncbi:bacteriohemerythrin [Candidatus Latescibacterota bacterium]